MAEEKIELPQCFSHPQKLASFGDEAHLAKLLEAAGGEKLVSAKDDYGCDGLTWASRNGRGNIVTLLLKKEGDVASKSFK